MIFSPDGRILASHSLKGPVRLWGVTRGAIYFHFDNKAGLFMALVEDASALADLFLRGVVA